MQIHPDDATTTLSATIATLKCGQRPKGLHGGAEIEALHAACRKRGWAHGWAIAALGWPVGTLLEIARDAHEEVYGNRANSIDTNRKA